MVVMPDRGIGVLARIPPLPPFVTPEELLEERKGVLEPPSRISVTDAAKRRPVVRTAVGGELAERRHAP